MTSSIIALARCALVAVNQINPQPRFRNCALNAASVTRAA